MKPMRVAWLGHSSTHAGDGLITYSRETVAGLQGMGVDVNLVHFGDEPAGVDSLALDALGLAHRLILPRAGSTRRLADYLKSEQVDVVHVSMSWSALDFWLPSLCKNLGLPLVATFHVPYDTRFSLYQLTSSYVYRLFASTLSRCDAVVIFGKRQRSMLERLGVSADRIHVVANGVDVTKYQPGPSTKRANLNADRLFSYVGRLDPEKNVPLLVKTFLTVNPDPRTRLVVVGDGAQRRRLERCFNDPRILFTGLITDEAERIAILRASEAFLLPSRVEGQSLALLEAMACGLAAVATDVGNDGEVLRGAGIVLDPQRVDQELNAAIRLLLGNPPLASQLGRLARQRVVDRYAIAGHVESLIDIYWRLVGRVATAVA
jgi:glycosyltransferase involved in cell wall biosynthesis